MDSSQDLPVQTNAGCPYNATFLQFLYGLQVVLANTDFTGNSAPCSTCYGGGWFAGPGGAVSAANVSVVNCTAGQVRMVRVHSTAAMAAPI